jgi:WD40-like Beta Propeller Repeat
MELRSLLVVGLVAAACSSAQPPAGTTVPLAVVATSIATPSASGLPVGMKRSPLNVPTSAAFSPDGRYVAYQSSNMLVLARIDGTVITSRPTSGPSRWLPDSTGLLIATSAPQRAAPLAILELDARITDTPLELTNPMLSGDGKTIVAEQQEGCCVSIIQREIRAAPRSGGSFRVVVTSSAPATATQAVSLLGIDDQDRVLYRDGDRISLVPLAGGPRQDLAIPPGLVPSQVVADASSPDRSVILLLSFDPTAAWMFFKGRLLAFPSEAGTIVRAGHASSGLAASPVWLGPQTILVRSREGSLASYDLSAYTPGFGSNALRSILPQFPTENALAYHDGAILWRSGDRVHVLAITTTDAVAAGIAGGFLLIIGSESYEISAP